MPKQLSKESQEHTNRKRVACYSAWCQHWMTLRRHVNVAIFIWSLAGIYMLMTNMDISVHVVDVYNQPSFKLWLTNIILFTISALGFFVMCWMDSYYIDTYIIPTTVDHLYKSKEEIHFTFINYGIFRYLYYAIFILGVVLMLTNKVISTGFWP